DFCRGADPESKGIVEHLVGYAERDLMVPAEPSLANLAAANAGAAQWCIEVNAVMHSEICAVPAQRLEAERELLGQLPSLRLEIAVERVRDRALPAGASNVVVHIDPGRVDLCEGPLDLRIRAPSPRPPRCLIAARIRPVSGSHGGKHRLPTIHWHKRRDNGDR